MLTQDDLKQLQALFEAERPATQRMIQAETEELHKGLQRVHADIGSLRTAVRALRKEVSFLHATVDILVKRTDEADVRLHRRVERLEDHLGLPPLPSSSSSSL